MHLMIIDKHLQWTGLLNIHHCSIGLMGINDLGNEKLMKRAQEVIVSNE